MTTSNTKLPLKIYPSSTNKFRRPMGNGNFSTENHLTKNTIDYDEEDRLQQQSSTEVSKTKVYLRLKSTQGKTPRNKEQQAYVILTDKILLTKTSTDNNPRNTRASRINEAERKRFLFTRVFGPQTSQAEIFQQSMRSQIMNFLAGQTSTVITYGTTNAGKSYTLFGTSSQPGVIPRSIKLIFSVINCTLSPWYKPTYGDRVINLDEPKRVLETQRKKRILNPDVIDKDQYAEVRTSLENSTPGTSNIEEQEQEYDMDVFHSMWLSFIEIYNENVYDLLSGNDEERNKPLKLITDKNGVAYVKGLQTVYVTTAVEACQILSVAQSRRNIASTTLNASSSRSHVIFVMKLLRYRKEDAPKEVEVSTLTFCDLAGCGRSREIEDERRLRETRCINNSLLVLGRCLKAVRESHTSNVDQITGLFRESKLTRILQNALSEKEQLIFMVNIDTDTRVYVETQSVLNFCTMAKKSVEETKRLKIISHDQKTINSWDALTLSSVTQTPERMSFANTSDLITLKQKNAALVRELESLRKKVLNRRRKTRRLSVHRSLEDLKDNVKEEVDARRSLSSTEIFRKSKSKSTLSSTPTRINREDLIDFEAYVTVKEENKQLKKEVDTLKSNALNREYEIRKELIDQYSSTIEDLEFSWKERTKEIEEEGQDLLRWSVKQVESFYKERIDSIMHGNKRKRTDSGDCTFENHTACEELEIENAQITSKVIVLRDMIKKLKEENEKINTEKNKYSFELALIKEEINGFQKLAKSYIQNSTTWENKANATSVVDTLRFLFEDTMKSIKVLEKCLNEAMDEYVNVTSNTLKIKEEFDEAKSTLEENSSKIKDLESQLSEKTEYAETLKLQLSEMSSVRNKYSVDASETFTDDYKMKPKDSLLTYGNHKFVMEKDIRNSNQKSSKFFSLTHEDSSFGDNNIKINDSEGSISEQRLEMGQERKRKSWNLSDIDHTIFRLSDASSKDDSGIYTGSSDRSRISTSFSDSIRTFEIENKSTQTSITRNAEDIREKTVIELYEELKITKEAMRALKEITSVNEKKIVEYKSILSSREKEYERRINELSRRLKFKEEKEDLTSKHLEEYLEMSDCLKDQLSVTRAQLDRTTIKCLTEHVPKIEKLEEKLLAKTLHENELIASMTEMQCDLTKINQLKEKVNEFEIVLNKCQGERDDFRKRLHTSLDSQSNLECKLKKLTEKIQERETEIVFLRTEINNIIQENSMNREKAKELSMKIRHMHQTTDFARSEISCFEHLRKNVERTSKQEIGNLKSRLAAFEKKAEFLRQVRETSENQQDELDRLRLQLLEKEREMNLFKKSKDTAIQMYESSREEFLNESSSARENLPVLEVPTSVSLERSVESPSTRHIKLKVPDPLADIIQESVENIENKRMSSYLDSYESSTFSMDQMSEESLSEITNAETSLVPMDCTKFHGVKQSDSTYDCEGSSQTESDALPNEPDCQILNKNPVTDKTEFLTDVCHIHNENRRGISGWMKIRRIGGRTKLSSRSKEYNDSLTSVSVSEESE